MANIKYTFISAIATLTLVFSSSVSALDVKITKDISTVNVIHKDKLIKIQRIQDQNHTLTGSYTKTSRMCPPFCVQPMQVAPDVKTVGELELINFIETQVNNGSGLLIDARTPGWFKKGTIPGSVNIPFTSFSEDVKPEVLEKALQQLGVVKDSGVASSLLSTAMSFFSDKKISSSNWNFSDAKEIMLWCNGMWCGQSPNAIRGLLALGYPADRIYYYRGGMQAWQSLGLTVQID